MILNKKAEIIDGAKKIYTHLVLAAHQDDIEIMCGEGIAKCYSADKCGLVAVVVSDGAGSPRSGEFANLTGAEMVKERRLEQIKAAEIGRYAKLIFLNYPSKELNSGNSGAAKDIEEIIREYRPLTVYSHNPADKHNTHVSVLKATLSAIRNLPQAIRPEKFYGCECWRDLDWLSDEDKVVFNLSGYEELLTKLLSCHKSQIAGGKRYDLAAAGRRVANATFLRSHSVDILTAASFGIDLTPLITEDKLSLRDFIYEKINKFKWEILV